MSALLSPAARVTLAMSAMFSAWGMAAPFLPRWLEVERGLSGTEIGAVLSAAMLARIAAGPAIAAWAEGYADRRAPLRYIAIATLILFAGLFYLADGFWAIFAIGFVAQVVGQNLSPTLEGAALRIAGRTGFPFGVSRAIGSTFFMLGNIGGGAAIAAIGLGLAVPLWTLAGLALTALAACFLLSPDPAPRVNPGFRNRLRRGLAIAAQPRILYLLLACSCIQAGHAFYYAFSAIVWRGQDVSATIVGMLWGFAVLVEIGFLLALRRVEQRVLPEHLIVAAALGGVVRWSALALAPTGWVLWPIQALHVLTFFPAHIGALRVLQRETPDDVSIFMQTLYAALNGGLFMGAATLASGWLYDRAGAGGYWLMTALCAAGFALMLRFMMLPATKSYAPS